MKRILDDLIDRAPQAIDLAIGDDIKLPESIFAELEEAWVQSCGSMSREEIVALARSLLAGAETR